MKKYWRFSTNISLYFENGRPTKYGHSYNGRNSSYDQPNDAISNNLQWPLT